MIRLGVYIPYHTNHLIAIPERNSPINAFALRQALIYQCYYRQYIIYLHCHGPWYILHYFGVRAHNKYICSIVGGHLSQAKPVSLQNGKWIETEHGRLSYMIKP